MKNKIISITFLIYILLFSILGIVIDDKEVSYSERRLLKKLPEYKFNNDYVEELEKYLLDHFPYRDNFRSIKANYNYKFLKKLDNNDIYLKDKYIFKNNYPTNEKSIQNFVKKTNDIKNILSKDNTIYMMIIPDKNYYLNDDTFLNIDYEYIYNQIDNLNFKNIDIRNDLNLSDFYETDTHWRQEKLNKIVKKISTVMNFEYNEHEYLEKIYDNFYGVYYGESALRRSPEKLIYLIDDNIINSKVTYLENKTLNTIYNIDNLSSFDSYEIYLDGASSFIEIYNKSSFREKELVIFRDSFASSITPLLIDYYSKITLIDNRYINSSEFKKLIEFDNQDILFMYSTLIINNSQTLKG